LTARAVYNEPYRAVPMRHRFGPRRADGMPASVEYAWKSVAGWTTIECPVDGPSLPAAPGSQEEFITEHYWGYTRQRDGGTIEYRVDHPRWRVAPIDSPIIAGDLNGTYGPAFGSILRTRPVSAFLADGSPVVVFAPTRIDR
jgi:uncharacterized protein